MRRLQLVLGNLRRGCKLPMAPMTISKISKGNLMKYGGATLVTYDVTATSHVTKTKYIGKKPFIAKTLNHTEEHTCNYWDFQCKSKRTWPTYFFHRYYKPQNMTDEAELVSFDEMFNDKFFAEKKGQHVYLYYDFGDKDKGKWYEHKFIYQDKNYDYEFVEYAEKQYEIPGTRELFVRDLNDPKGFIINNKTWDVNGKPLHHMFYDHTGSVVTRHYKEGLLISDHSGKGYKEFDMFGNVLTDIEYKNKMGKKHVHKYIDERSGYDLVLPENKELSVWIIGRSDKEILFAKLKVPKDAKRINASKPSRTYGLFSSRVNRGAITKIVDRRGVEQKEFMALENNSKFRVGDEILSDNFEEDTSRYTDSGYFKNGIVCYLTEELCENRIYPLVYILNRHYRYAKGSLGYIDYTKLVPDMEF